MRTRNQKDRPVKLLLGKKRVKYRTERKIVVPGLAQKLSYLNDILIGVDPKKGATVKSAPQRVLFQKNPVQSSSIKDGIATFHVKRTTRPDKLMDAGKPVRERLLSIGAEPGANLDDSRVQRVMRALTDSAKDVTGSAEVARQMLTSGNFDGTGLSAEQLVREGRAVRVLSRIDDLRFGARG